MMVQSNKRRNDALKEGQELFEYACDMKKKVKQNKKYIEQQVERNDLNNVVTPAMKLAQNRLKDAMKTVSLTNDDLSLIVNGKPNDRSCSPFFFDIH